MSVRFLRSADAAAAIVERRFHSRRSRAYPAPPQEEVLVQIQTDKPGLEVGWAN